MAILNVCKVENSLIFVTKCSYVVLRDESILEERSLSATKALHKIPAFKELSCFYLAGIRGHLNVLFDRNS